MFLAHEDREGRVSEAPFFGCGPTLYEALVLAWRDAQGLREYVPPEPGDLPF